MEQRTTYAATNFDRWRITISSPRRRARRSVACHSSVLPTGCVRRRVFVQSNPPGAMLFVDNQQIGTTPCSVDFTYYGTREIRLVKPGFETLTVNQPIPTPWYQVPPIDFVSENLIPTNLIDHRSIAFNMQPQVIVPTDQLLDRANQLRQDTLQGTVVPAAAVGVPGAPQCDAHPWYNSAARDAAWRGPDWESGSAAGDRSQHRCQCSRLLRHRCSSAGNTAGAADC